ncbi:4-hydroxy-tetrahydrodipicolinate reductase [Homoserinimonas sp. A447]
MTTTVAVAGATGTMGRLASRLIGDSADFEVVASLSSTSELSDLDGADLVVDFTHPAVSPRVVEHAITAGMNVLVGTSGWSSERIVSLRRTLEGSPEVGVVIIPNFSLGSALVSAFSAMAARFYDSIEIIEAHHAGKVDSPSGTAVRTAELIGLARASLGPVAAPHTDQRARGQQVSSVPIHSVRMSGVIARQDVMFGAAGELVTLRHETTSPQSYEAGILLGLAAARDARGVVVGLESLIDLTPGRTSDR